MENVTTPIGKPLSKERITMVEIIANLKHEVCKLTKLRVKQLEEKNKGLQNHLISLKFNMDDWKLQLVEAEKNIHAIEVAVQIFMKQQSLSQLVVCVMQYPVYKVWSIQVFISLTTLGYWKFEII